MKKLIFWLAISGITFGIGLGASAYLCIPDMTDAGELEFVQPVNVVDCQKSRSFPGISWRTSELKKVKNGFFPAGTFADAWENQDDSLNSWYGRFLSAMSEPSLLEKAEEKDEIYRFLWLRTFHHPVEVTVERKGYRFNLISKELNGKGGFEPGQMLRSDRRSLSQDEWCGFMGRLESTDYWNEDTMEHKSQGRDGSRWILEGLRDSRYHLVDRWTPDSGQYREACLYLLELSGRNTAAMGNDLY